MFFVATILKTLPTLYIHPMVASIDHVVSFLWTDACAVRPLRARREARHAGGVAESDETLMNAARSPRSRERAIRRRLPVRGPVQFNTRRSSRIAAHCSLAAFAPNASGLPSGWYGVRPVELV